MHDFDSARGALLLLALPLFAANASAAATTTRTQDQRLIWGFQDDFPLPASSHLGAVLTMTTEGGFAWAGAPSGGAWASFTHISGHPGWWDHEIGPFAPLPQAFAAAADGYAMVQTELEADGTTTIRMAGVGGVPLILGITGEVAAVVKRGPVIAYGQPDHAGGAGWVRIYEYEASSSSWQLEATFVGGAGDRLGASLAIEDFIVVAGAPGNGANGSVFVYARASSWIELQQIDSPSTSQSNEEFGAAIALDGQWLAIGAPRHDRFLIGGGQVDCGGVWVYRAGFLLFELDRFVRPGAIAAGDRFGTSVAVRRIGPLAAALVAGSPREDGPPGNAGAAYLFLHSGDAWLEHLRLVDDAPGAADNLGTTVALDGRDVLAGAPNADANGVFAQGNVLAYHHVVPLFYDMFESGDVLGWSASTP
jgi:hypothetical protein